MGERLLTQAKIVPGSTQIIKQHEPSWGGFEGYSLALINSLLRVQGPVNGKIQSTSTRSHGRTLDHKSQTSWRLLPGPCFNNWQMARKKEAVVYKNARGKGKRRAKERGLETPRQLSAHWRVRSRKGQAFSITLTWHWRDTKTRRGFFSTSLWVSRGQWQEPGSVCPGCILRHADGASSKPETTCWCSVSAGCCVTLTLWCICLLCSIFLFTAV